MENSQQFKIYGMIIEIRDTVFLSVQYATCLEEAFAQAKLEFERVNPILKNKLGNISGAKIGLFTIKTPYEMTEENKSFLNNVATYEKEEKKIKEETKKPANPSINKFLNTPEKREKLAQEISMWPKEKQEKNLLMAKIIKEGSKEFFDTWKATLTKEERQYIEERLNKNVK